MSGLSTESLLRIHLATAEERIAALTEANTFWACKDHTHNNTLRCALCDEARLKKLEARIAALETALGTQAARNAKLKVALEAMADIAPHNNQRAAILAEVIK